MIISIEHHAGKYPSFNVSLAASAGREPFLTIKGCRVVDGTKGRFISWPARKQDDGKYWNHVYASEAFNTAVLAEVDKTQPPRAKDDGARARQTADDDVPF